MNIQSIAIIGAGIMGMGIAQIAAQAGMKVQIYDSHMGNAQQGLNTLKTTLEKLQQKGKFSEEELKQILSRILIVDTLEQVDAVDLVIEAIIEDLEIKQNLFKQLEKIVSTDTILASNTSSLSITAIASVLEHPERVAGFHFFNPVPLMKIVEVVAGLMTQNQVINTLLDFAKTVGHLGVTTKDTPGFIVNHAGRAYGTEALKIFSEGVASFSEIDRILRDGAGFRMGPFELLDLTGLDVSHPVMESIYYQYYEEDRYRPNPLTRQMLEGKKIGRKVGEGFYRYENGNKQNEAPVVSIPKVDQFNQIWLQADRAQDVELLKQYLQQHGLQLDESLQPDSDSLIILATYGEDTTTAALRYGVDPKRAVNIDMLTDFARHRTLMPSLMTDQSYIDQAHAIFAQDNVTVSVIDESYGFVAQRVLAMVINLACDIAQQKIATASDIDQAVKLGLGYPSGPISWGDSLGADRILLILERILASTHDQRYRASPWLKRRVQLGLPLLYQS
ncbi:3-hydroxyacyl-CoA dehydrogenase [Acinetobacter shaoyimingii]|uniref:3-hydroxyacyl-CoA dehydrogenase n=1 Tax=Acinetobacter shaoyimingii TaxID=2715164 RepID=A0A6G8RVC9_9GAMM|nr:3-hydroxyacyl-CoA dehydrogenase [Acinetobacter shaoyimingii]QIO05841.1 3-hydroxyacyl-CoA dehydrogenase [Acinetobacter shaoyimingii]